MSIEILPAQLANQIAAGEVVERPASVIKELVENSLDAGATSIKIHIEKGGAKRIKISDNGSGISKDELSLALSRHATSKIKTLNDLEGISSLGFRGEALASISSVSRLTLTSKPAEQELAWQASAEGRDMIVDIKPAAHANGTTIDVQDLFFNTPARRKFLRTDKTEFSHIEEVIKRIALACLDVTFVLMHNDKLVRQYRAATTKAQCAKRVAQICGQKFIEHALEVECQHDDLHFSGWLAKPSFSRNQNDLCYSYVNGRMMRDKLINHAIRQAYNDLLPVNTYPAFVLFLTLNHRDVDVNVHPAKHEVRFHQGRYIHDFIFSVCHRALSDSGVTHLSHANEHEVGNEADNESNTHTVGLEPQSIQYNRASIDEQQQSYIKPLSYVKDASPSSYSGAQHERYTKRPTAAETSAYYQLMDNTVEEGDVSENSTTFTNKLNHTLDNVVFLHLVQESFALIQCKNELRLLSLQKLETSIVSNELLKKWEVGFISQPLLLPVKVKVDESQVTFIEHNQQLFERSGLILNITNKSSIQIREFPALLRHKDVANSFFKLLDVLMSKSKINSDDYYLCFMTLLSQETYEVNTVHSLFERMKNLQSNVIDSLLLLNSCSVDLTSEINQLM